MIIKVEVCPTVACSGVIVSSVREGENCGTEAGTPICAKSDEGGAKAEMEE